MRRFLFVAGGTGGHVFPALAVMQEMADRGHICTFITDKRGARFVNNTPCRLVAAEAMMGRGLWQKMKALPIMAWGYGQSHILLWRLRPDVVVGFGGYAALPLVLAAQHQGRWTMIHEQNAVMGRVNRLLAVRAKRTFLSFAQTQKVPPSANSEHTGNPLVMKNMAANVDQEKTDQQGTDIELLILGGSQGAEVFDRVVPEALALLPLEQRKRLRLKQQVVTRDAQELQAYYAELGIKAFCAPFIHHAAQEMSGASLMIARAGAGITTEASLAHLPSIFVPLPFAADNHQWYNAEFYAKAGAAENIVQSAFDAETLAGRISYFLTRPERLQQMRGAMATCANPHALQTLAMRLENDDQTA